MSIICAAVKSPKDTVIAYKDPKIKTSEVGTLTDRLLQQVSLTTDTKKSYSSKGLTFNYITDGGVCYLCVAEEAFVRRICFGFLERIKNEHTQKGKVNKNFLESEMTFFFNKSRS